MSGDEGDAFITDVLAMSEDELRADIIAEGRDPDEVVAGMKRELSAVIELVRERNRHEADAREWQVEYKQARREKNEAIAETERLRAALCRACCAMDGATVFVTSRERIKRPEGEQWWAEEIAAARAVLHGDKA